MSGSITLRNGYIWIDSGSAFCALIREITAWLDPVVDQVIINKINDPSGVVDVVDLIDLQNEKEWPTEQAIRFESVIMEAYQNIAEYDSWRVLTKPDPWRAYLFKCLAKICEVGILRRGIALHDLNGSPNGGNGNR
ncbi:MAG: hypothetical protein V4710_22120 [Verrucomicrobiota bacterium]